MTRRAWIAVAVLAAALAMAIGVTWFLRTYHRVERTVDMPRVGEIRWNKLFVLQLALERDGMRARALPRLTRDLEGIAPGDTLLLLGDPRSLDASASARVLVWVESGGHLLLRTPPKLEIGDGQPVPVLAALGVEVLDVAPACTSLQVAGEDHHIEFCQGRRFEVAGPTLHAWRGQREPVSAGVELDQLDMRQRREVERLRRQAKRDTAANEAVANDVEPGAMDERVESDDSETGEDTGPTPLTADEAAALVRLDLARGDTGARGLVYARLVRGRGTVDMLADFDMLLNDAIVEVPHTAFARQLFPRARPGTVHLVYDAQLPSFWMQLLAGFWMAWKPLALALLAWLWMRAQRFGPRLPTPPAERRSLLEHIAASGEHAWRYGHGARLHGAMRDAFLARLRRRDPVAGALEGEPQIAAIAERTRQPSAVVRDALTTPVGADPATFRSRIAALVRLRHLLQVAASRPP